MDHRPPALGFRATAEDRAHLETIATVIRAIRPAPFLSMTDAIRAALRVAAAAAETGTFAELAARKR
jgi:hypothetical protein